MSSRAKWILLLAVTVLTATAAYGGSIYARAGARTQALFADDTARKIGDNLTIMINERAVIANETKRALDRKSDRNASTTQPTKFMDVMNDATGKLFNLENLNVQTAAETKWDGDAKFDSGRSMIDQITVTVTDVMPNGNLVVIGSRTREVEGDKQIIQVSGVVRVSDISFANTVASEKVAEFKIVYKHKGMENRFTKPAWFDRILNVVSPY